MKRYCLQCSMPMVFKKPEGDFQRRFCCDQCGFIFYENPKMVCGVLAFWDEKVLLCKRDIEPQRGKWTLPAGFMELGETPKEAAIREAYEEAELSVSISHLHCVFAKKQIDQVYLIFKGQMTCDHYACTPETSAIELLSVNEALKMDLAFSSVRYALERCLEVDDHEQKTFYTD